MILQWSHRQRERITNATLACYAIPIAIHRYPSGWSIRVFGGTLRIAIERMRAKQDAIVRRSEERGIEFLSPRDALFMYVSQWVEWFVTEDLAPDDRHSIHEIMEHWLIIYDSICTKFRN